MPRHADKLSSQYRRHIPYTPLPSFLPLSPHAAYSSFTYDISLSPYTPRHTASPRLPIVFLRLFRYAPEISMSYFPSSPYYRHYLRYATPSLRRQIYYARHDTSWLLLDIGTPSLSRHYLLFIMFAFFFDKQMFRRYSSPPSTCCLYIEVCHSHSLMLLYVMIYCSLFAITICHFH